MSQHCAPPNVMHKEHSTTYVVFLSHMPDWQLIMRKHQKDPGWRSFERRKSFTFFKNVKVKNVRKSLRNCSLLKKTEGMEELNAIHDPRLDPELREKKEYLIELLVKSAWSQ